MEIPPQAQPHRTVCQKGWGGGLPATHTSHIHTERRSHCPRTGTWKGISTHWGPQPSLLGALSSCPFGLGGSSSRACLATREILGESEGCLLRQDQPPGRLHRAPCPALQGQTTRQASCLFCNWYTSHQSQNLAFCCISPPLPRSPN